MCFTRHGNTQSKQTHTGYMMHSSVRREFSDVLCPEFSDDLKHISFFKVFTVCH